MSSSSVHVLNIVQTAGSETIISVESSRCSLPSLSGMKKIVLQFEGYMFIRLGDPSLSRSHKQNKWTYLFHIVIIVFMTIIKVSGNRFHETDRIKKYVNGRKCCGWENEAVTLTLCKRRSRPRSEYEQPIGWGLNMNSDSLHCVLLIAWIPFSRCLKLCLSR